MSHDSDNHPANVSLRPIAIAILAPDGAGKTTLLKRLACELRPHFEGVTRFHFLHLTEAEIDSEPNEDPHGQPPRSAVVSLAKIVYYLLKAWTTRRRQISAAMSKGHVVLLDRDVIDVALDPRRYRVRAPSWVLALVRRWSPRPSITIVLDADPRVLRSRSSELEVDMLVHLRQRYLDYAQKGPRAVVVDANKGPEEVTAQALEVLRIITNMQSVSNRNRRDEAPNRDAK